MTSQRAREERYWAAAAQSYIDQERGITIPVGVLSSIVEITFGGSQPLGIVSRPFGEGDQIAIATYLEPAVCTADVKRDENGLRFQVDWIRGAQHGIQRVRLFYDISLPSGANRAQTVNFGPQDTLWVSRNGESDFYVFSPPQGGERWILTDRLTLPTSMLVHSALLAQTTLFTVESPGSLKDWSLKEYRLEDRQFTQVRDPISIPDYMYGIGRRQEEDTAWLVTDFRATAPHGVYRVRDGESELVVPGVEGSGIAFLSDGSALVTRYGQSHPGAFNGIPGALIYVPSNRFTR